MNYALMLIWYRIYRFLSDHKVVGWILWRKKWTLLSHILSIENRLPLIMDWCWRFLIENRSLNRLLSRLNGGKVPLREDGLLRLKREVFTRRRHWIHEGVAQV